MSEAKRIAEQLKRAFEGEAWHGPSVLEVIADVEAEDAAAHPVEAGHSIWEIVLHLTTWEDVVRRRLLGEKVASTSVDDWPAVGDPTGARWREAVARLQRGNRALHEVIEALDDAGLDEPAVPGGSSRYVQAHGAVQHDLYHAGQMMLLRRALEA